MIRPERSDDSYRVRDAEDAKRSWERSGRDRAQAESGASPGPKGDALIRFLGTTRPLSARERLPSRTACLLQGCGPCGRGVASGRRSRGGDPALDGLEGRVMLKTGSHPP